MLWRWKALLSAFITFKIHADVSSQIVTKVIGPEGLEYFWRQLCHLNPLRSLREGSRALSRHLLVGRNKWVLTVKTAVCCPFFSVLPNCGGFRFWFFINTCSDDAATCKNNEQHSTCFCRLTGKCILFALLMPRPAVCPSRHPDWTQTRAVQQRRDGLGFLWGHLHSEKSTFFEDFWVMAESQSQEPSAYWISWKKNTDSTNIYIFSSGMLFWLLTVDLQLGREKSHFKLLCRPIEIPDLWFSTPEIRVSYTFPLISISVCK